MVSVVRLVLVVYLPSHVVPQVLLCIFELILQSLNLPCCVCLANRCFLGNLSSQIPYLLVARLLYSGDLVSLSFSPHLIQFSQHLIDQSLSEPFSVFLSVIMGNLKCLLGNPTFFFLFLNFLLAICLLLGSKEPHGAFVV